MTKIKCWPLIGLNFELDGGEMYNDSVVFIFYLISNGRLLFFRQIELPKLSTLRCSSLRSSRLWRPRPNADPCRSCYSFGPLSASGLPTGQERSPSGPSWPSHSSLQPRTRGYSRRSWNRLRTIWRSKHKPCSPQIWMMDLYSDSVCIFQPYNIVYFFFYRLSCMLMLSNFKCLLILIFNHIYLYFSNHDTDYLTTKTNQALKEAIFSNSLKISFNDSNETFLDLMNPKPRIVCRFDDFPIISSQKLIILQIEPKWEVAVQDNQHIQNHTPLETQHFLEVECQLHRLLLECLRLHLHSLHQQWAQLVHLNQPMLDLWDQAPFLEVRAWLFALRYLMPTQDLQAFLFKDPISLHRLFDIDSFYSESTYSFIKTIIAHLT